MEKEKPVSYTHLDVYKRQHQNPRQFEDFKREMDMVVERYRWQECFGLSD